MRKRLTAVLAFLLLPTLPLSASRSQQDLDSVDAFQAALSALRSLNSLAAVKAAATTVPDHLLLRMLQFDAPYPGFFQELQLYRDGSVITFRHVPSWAMQGSSGGKLVKDRLDEVRRTLEALELGGYTVSSEPEPGRLHTVLIFFDGLAYQHRDFNGPLPPRIQVPIDVIKDALKAPARDTFENALKEEAAAKQILSAGSGWNVATDLHWRPLKDVRGLLLTVTGVRGAARTSVYHALVFYPEGTLLYPPSNPGNWAADNPLARVTTTWQRPNGPGGIGIKTVTHNLEINYRLIEGTMSIGTDSFRLSEGNLFIIQFDSNWSHAVRAVHAHVDEPSPDQATVDAFKSQLRTDAVIQSLLLAD